MVRPVESIRKDLNALEEATATLADEFSQIYGTYLSVLGQAMRRQMMMATYHLCTQVYPEEFLALTVSDRTHLQQGIQKLGRQAQSWLQQLMEPSQSSSRSTTSQALDPSDLSRLEVALASLTSPPDGADPVVGDSTSGAELSPEPSEPVQPPSQAGSEMNEAELEDGDPGLSISPKDLVQSVIMAAISSEVEEAFSRRPFTGDSLTPATVAKHHLILERMIRDVLQRVSKKANQLLRKAEVIPDLPESVLEVASDVELASPRGRSAPNVMNVLVAVADDIPAEFENSDRISINLEAETDERDRPEEEEEALEGAMTHLAAIQMRLTDLEFGDVQTALWRGKLRTAIGRLRKLGKQYQRAERELAIAQAEQAWRSVWYDDSSR
ncbi:hypothetical protein IQ254_22500 [Nodosilinea sp. LEGE 07088]|uniref:hypothetical protein n=1 Tax=Nodosilinea sp. LEGE 07088 TaxID=2777968 RepID=UPI00187F0BFB|nr:hypothetical protein [Nodosilinea sp. LEGE 07088]MBE9139930.1 hypothetical protein [Nodosilinea sp. LEGE 07088]